MTGAITSMKKQLITITFFGLLAGLASVADAKDVYYKWVDENHITHYSQKPPENLGKDVKVEVVSVTTRLPIDSASAMADLDKKRAEAAKAREDAGKKEGVRKVGDKADAMTQQANKTNCEQWRREMQLLEEKAQVKVLDEQGNAKVMTEDEKKARIDKTKKQIQEYCAS